MQYDGKDILSHTGEAYARHLDCQDSLAHLRNEFMIPTRADLVRPTLHPHPASSLNDDVEGRQKNDDSTPCIYLCGHSLGLQPRRTKDLVASCLSAWSVKGVQGHFKGHSDSPLPPFVHFDDYAAKLMAPIVGAREDEVAIMGTLTANLHILMASFYRPSASKHKVILEAKSFPSDHYAVESAIRLAGFDSKEAMILLEPLDAEATISTTQILETIDRHANSTALILLPGVQFYTGQYLDIETITHHAHLRNILIGWDCAHAAGNVQLALHDWNVDFAVWCTYKYLNSGPGAIAALFVHERHGRVDMAASVAYGEQYRPRLCGWWGADKHTRFDMENNFVPRPGASGYQLSNPSILDLTAVIASLQVFHLTIMSKLRQKSVSLTAYLETLLKAHSGSLQVLEILTPEDPAQRGAQLSLKLKPGLLGPVMMELEANGVMVDERKPDVIRVAPAPLYNSFEDVWQFCNIFKNACSKHAVGAGT